MLDHVPYLAVPLPEDIRRRKDAGYFSEALKLIELRLRGNLPQALRKRLELERELIPVWEADYPYSFDEALAILSENISGFTREEFDKYIDEGLFDWIYRDGKMYFIRTFYDNLLKVQHPVTARLSAPQQSGDAQLKQTVLNENMRTMKEKGGNAYLIRIRTTLKVKEEARAWAAGLPSICRFPVREHRSGIFSLSPFPPALLPHPRISRAVRSAFRGPWKKTASLQ